MVYENIIILYSPKCIEYESPDHPESPLRLSSSFEFLKKKGFKFKEPKPCSEKDILAVHSLGLLNKIKERDFFDPDTPALVNIYEYASLSCGAAIEAVQLALEAKFAFSLMRPPGHHATKNNLGGFCYFNNIAIAVTKVLDSLEKAAILDIDVHHGNGTQDIFLGNNKVLYVSLHQSPLYPGTGLFSEKNCLNFPLAAGASRKEYLDTLRGALGEIKKFNPSLLAVSAGFDTYKLDPLAGLGLDLDSYRQIAQLISEIKVPSFCVLEGGYSNALGECIYNFITGWVK